ncbi:FAD-binding oxidoreductase [Sporosarcina sp. ANT_H38]|uniref:NAD(P)/FAD-dependent oxidoreductase n=1 Tax=Sporosarcina sp. ANT_H38 TaxID=2597358 RepID=UPI0011F0D597|nr:FAD-dependent oxidoreductase [Sporosarcina sp. ANT_H38]KAA0944203.1 FAD-binding oxidoreductase [Sporosarcina sp. ANT_H38]
MHIHEGSLYWPGTMPIPPERKKVEIASHYDVIIVGGGMSGALSALALADKELSIAVLDKRQMATGSTMANTGLLQYSNDIMLHELIEQIGEKDAVRFYQLCLDAMDNLKKTAERLPLDPDFISRPSVYYASDDTDLKRIRKEYETLKRYGFPCDYWNEDEIRKYLPFSKPGAIVTYGDAEVNPYKFVNGILQVVESMGVHLFEFTDVNDVTEENGLLHISTSSGEFHADKVLFTTGYETLPVGKRIGADINRSYVIVTEPLDASPIWHENALIWESKRPYLYMRTTEDNRIIVGGLDEDKPQAPLSNELIMKHGDNLKKQLQALFPELPIEIDYAYCATFGESLDNLPFIGEHPSKRNHYYLLGYGGNGTVYSMLGSTILADSMTGKANSDAHIVQLERSATAKTGGRSVIA